MASASGTFCGVCETQHVVREATFWCSECDEGLCSSCEKHHRASKASRNHEVISVNNYQKIPNTIANINQYCSDHEKKYQLYCSKHEKLCCPLCITRNHKTCDLMAIDDIVKTSKTSALFDIMEQSLKDMKSNMKKIVEDRKQNLEKIQQQRQRFQTDIKEIREKINKHLDKLEKKIQQDIQVATQKVQSQIEKLHSKISDNGKSLDELSKNIFATKSFATDLQTFFGGKMFEAEIQKEEKFMQSLIEDGSLQQINLQCKLDDKMSDILSMTKIGDISIITNSPTITLTIDRDKQAQHMVPTISKTMNDINPTLLKKFEIPKGEIGIGITGCTIMPSRKIVFVDRSNDRLVIHNENGLFDYEISVSRLPFDVACVEENVVAVTHNAEPYHIEIIDIRNKKILNKIKTNNQCYGITNNKGRLIYYEKRRGIQTAEAINESTVTTLVKFDDVFNYCYVTASNNKIYNSNYDSGTVTCYTITGQKVWEYKNESILKRIRGVTVDNDSNVYVASRNYNSVVGVSPDGKNARELLKENWIDWSYGIHFDQGRNILLITNLDGIASLYNI
ncbi:uncharacterized protein LOC127729954 [Mytilus californianus]|uniref:uncharacterized protein LOC127729954 n=1 Tax=Mytilus californianus TaxID=6549 RepID=UPI002245BCFB|nr:uncharacterized protein LOC127729954 [Mytilus californianus]XP_052093901.1 uncharacterized protein LOC127729954 [Mytilus californianus]